MLTSILNDDRGAADLPSVYVACFVTLIVAGVGTLVALNAINHYEDNQVRAEVQGIAEKLDNGFASEGRYVHPTGVDELSEHLALGIGNNEGCYTLVGTSNKKAFIIESGDSDLELLEQGTTAQCIGESQLQQLLKSAGHPVTGRTGKEILQPAGNFQDSGSALSWAPVAEATKYSVIISKNGVEQTPLTVTTPTVAYVATPGDAVKFKVTAVSANAESKASEFIRRQEPPSPVGNAGFSSTSGWTKASGSGTFTTQATPSTSSDQCFREPADTAALLGNDASILSGSISASKTGGAGSIIRFSADSCGPVAPVIRIEFSARVTVPERLASDLPALQWDLRKSKEIEIPAGTSSFKVRIMNPGTEGPIWVDNVNITAVR